MPHVPFIYSQQMVPNKQESGSRDYFKKQNILQGWISKNNFTRD